MFFLKREKKFKASKLLTKYPTTQNQLISTFYTNMFCFISTFSVAIKEMDMDLRFGKEALLITVDPEDAYLVHVRELGHN